MADPASRHPAALLRSLAAAVLLLAALHSLAQAASIRVLAVVNGTPVTNLDFEERRNFLVKTTGIQDNPETAGQIDNDVLQMLVDDIIKRDEALRLGGDREAEARARAEEIVERSFSQHGEDAGAVMQRLGIDRRFAVEKYMVDVLWASAVQARFAEEFSNVGPEAERELERITANALKAQIDLDEIVLLPGPNRDMPQTLAVARQMADAIRGGADFGRIAQQFSASGTAAQGGSIGWVVLERLPDNIRAAVGELPAGSVADPVEIDGAIVVYRVNGRREGGKPDPLETRVSLGRLVLPVAADDRGSREAAAAKVTTETLAVTDCAGLEQVHNGYGSGQDFDFGEVRLGELSPRLRGLLSPLEPGGMTGPIDISGGVVVFMVCDRAVPQLALPSIAEVENRIRNRHFSVLASRYLAQLRRQATIDRKGAP